MDYKVYIENTSKPYEDMFLERNFEITKNFEEADLVQFTGGPDVGPVYYKEHTHKTTKIDSRRDDLEYHTFNNCTYYHTPMVGICRGAQLLNVMNRGKLWQNVDGHRASNHPLIDKKTGRIICEVSSTHHQMMRPFGGQILAIAKEATFLEDANDKYGCKLIDYEDTEVVYFKKTKSLCFQPHPEFEGMKACREYYFNLIFKYLLTGKPKAERPQQKKPYRGHEKTYITFTDTGTIGVDAGTAYTIGVNAGTIRVGNIDNTN